MIYDTAGNRIIEPIRTCNCGLTGGCSNCRPTFIGSITDEEAKNMKEKLADWKKRFNEDFEEKASELKLSCNVETARITTTPINKENLCCEKCQCLNNGFVHKLHCDGCHDPNCPCHSQTERKCEKWCELPKNHQGKCEYYGDIPLDSTRWEKEFNEKFKDNYGVRMLSKNDIAEIKFFIESLLTSTRQEVVEEIRDKIKKGEMRTLEWKDADEKSGTYFHRDDILSLLDKK